MPNLMLATRAPDQNQVIAILSKDVIAKAINDLKGIPFFPLKQPQLPFVIFIDRTDLYGRPFLKCLVRCFQSIARSFMNEEVGGFGVKMHARTLQNKINPKRQSPHIHQLSYLTSNNHQAATMIAIYLYEQIKINYNSSDRYIFKAVNEMIKPTASFKAMPLLQSTKDKKEKEGRQQPIKVNWLVQRNSLSKDNPSKQSLTTKNEKANRQNIYPIKERQKNIKCYLHKEITLLSSLRESKEKENRNHFIKNSEDSSEGIRSQKVSCEKKQKLSIMSKRPSLRKINDFISFQTNQQEEASKPVSSQQEQQWNGVGHIQNEVQTQIRREGQARKKCIRISVKRRVLGEINKI